MGRPKGRRTLRDILDDPELFWEKVDPVTETWNGEDWCWLYGKTKPTTKSSEGYKYVMLASSKYATDNKSLGSHRISAILTYNMPEDQEPDHKCPNRWCCNPSHLEPVTPEENARRSSGMIQTGELERACKRGHVLRPLSDGTFVCLHCKNEANRKYMTRYREKKNSISFLSS